jgi:hypothetical protein
MPKEAFILMHSKDLENRDLCFNPDFWNEETLEQYLPKFQKKEVAEPNLWQELRNWWSK